MKRLFAVLLSIAFVLSLSCCDYETDILKSEKMVAVKYASANENAAEEYIKGGYKKVTYNSSSDVVIAVENKKADIGILDDFELNSLCGDRNILSQSTCEYSIDYCAYFNSEDTELKKSFDKAIVALEEAGTLEKIKDAHLKGEDYKPSKKNPTEKALVMLCDPSFDNRIYTDKNGDIVGLDVDIAQEICNYLGYDIEFVVADTDELFIELDDGTGDFILSALEVNEQREKYYLSSTPYFTLNFHTIVRK